MVRALSHLVCVIFLIGCGVNRSDPAEVAEAYVDAVYYADLSLFTQAVAKRDYEANEDHKLFYNKDSTGKSNTREQRGGIAALETDDAYINKSRATVRVHVVFVNGERRDIRLSLFQEDGDWFVKPVSWSGW